MVNGDPAISKVMDPFGGIQKGNTSLYSRTRTGTYDIVQYVRGRGERLATLWCAGVGGVESDFA